MASMVLTDCLVSVGGNDISDHIAGVTINYAAELQDDTAMGDTSRSRIGGLKDWSIDLDVIQDYAVGVLDSLMFPLVGTSVAIIIRPVKSTVVGTSNPNYTGNAILAEYKPVQGNVGDLAKTPITLQGTGTLTRATA